MRMPRPEEHHEEDETEKGSRRPNPIDIHVGGRVRFRRMLLGMSQEKLGERLGLTFQQVQKYEKGINRIGASRLFDLSQVLGVPVQFFYDDAPMGTPAGFPSPGFGEKPNESYVVDFLASNEVLQDTLYFENEQYDDEGFGRLLESDGATFGIGTDIGDFVWGLVFDDHTGRHWQTSRHGHLQQLTKRPADRSTQEIASSLGRDMERVDPKFDRLHLWAPQHLPDNPPPKLTEGLHLRGWPRYLFITGLQRAERALVWLKKNW